MEAKVEEVLELDESLFIDRGTTQACYRHPRSASLCIKVVHAARRQKDVDREVRYRALLDRQGRDSGVFARYFGTVATSLGTGYVYEKITDDDGALSKSLRDYVRNETMLRNDFSMVASSLRELRRSILDNRLVTLRLIPPNIMFQKRGGTCRARIIDDIGSNSPLPLEYWVGALAWAREYRRWEILKRHIVRERPFYVVMKLSEEI